MRSQIVLGSSAILPRGLRRVERNVSESEGVGVSVVQVVVFISDVGLIVMR